MATVLNSDLMDPRERADAMAAALLEASAPAYLVHKAPGEQVRARFESWRLGPVELRHTSLSGFTLVRTRKQIRHSPAGALVCNVQRLTSARVSHADRRFETGPGQMFLIDIDLPYEIDWRGGTGTALILPTEGLGLPTETILAGLQRSHRSPLYALVARHIELLARTADTLEDDPAAGELGEASTELVRAFLLSAAAGTAVDGAAVPAGLLLNQVRDHIRRHLSDPRLGPERIAKAHNISVRQLYKLCQNAGCSLEQWIIAERLERARDDLAHPDARQRSIAAIAYANGFRDPAHFARRFRGAYGTTPSRWRRENGP
ncbi:helix-turn-helix domain-containing protein [Nocardia sp. NPDC051570]|uniref:helix-turn-helix domain-containing protein n=1 Tax=Nocardia sp. NPDC051570 TaxID=3364324 RepID=UPI0037B6E341